MADVTGIDHIYITVSDLAKSEAFYDQVLLGALGFRKNKFTLAGDPQYAPDYTATFFSDPDGIRLEITNYRQARRERHDNWEELRG